MSLMTTAVAFILALGPLVVFHELGHYLVARACGVKVLRFCVGFGKVLVSRRVGADRTEWAVAAIPFGGYVKMLDEREAPVEEAELHRAFNRQSLGRRAAIVVAGPLANLLLAVLLYWVVFLHGASESRALLAEPPAGSAAAVSQLHEGDEVVRVGAAAVRSWQQLRWLLLPHAVDGDRVELQLRRADGTARVRSLDLSGLGSDDIDADFLRRCGLLLYLPPIDAVVGTVLPGSAGEAAGLLPGDRILAADGQAVRQFQDLVARVSASAGRPLVLQIERASRRMDVTVTPAPVREGAQTIGRIGVRPRLDEHFGENLRSFVSYGPVEALVAAAQRTWDTSRLTVEMIGKMVLGRVSMKNLSGPLTIADYAGQSAKLGWLPYIAFIAMISISLGVLNLLPVPVLDGGHLMYYIVESIRGRPLSERALALGQQVGLAALLTLMAFAIYNDIHRLWGG